MADRYAASSLAYGDAQGLDLAWLTDVQRLLPPADLTFLLDIAPETSLARKRAARDKFERDLPLLSRVRASYVRQAAGARLASDRRHARTPRPCAPMSPAPYELGSGCCKGHDRAPAPAGSSASAAAESVAPVVSTSSTSATDPATHGAGRARPSANAPRTLAWRAAPEAATCGLVWTPPRQRLAHRRPEGGGDERRLIEPALAFPPRMERHRHHDLDGSGQVVAPRAHQAAEARGHRRTPSGTCRRG